MSISKAIASFSNTSTVGFCIPLKIRERVDLPTSDSNANFSDEVCFSRIIRFRLALTLSLADFIYEIVTCSIEIDVPDTAQKAKIIVDF